MTLRDYLRTMREHRVLIVAVTILAAALALGLTLPQRRIYTAQASVSLRDISEDYGAVGIPVAPAQTQQQLSAAAAQTTTTAEVASRVKRQLNSNMSVAQLQSSVTATVDQSSNFVIVQAHDRTAAGAAALANAFATQSTALSNNDAKTRFAAQARSIRTKIAQFGGSRAKSSAKIELESERARFLSLANFAQPATIVESATPPSGPSSPKPVFDAFLGAVIGLIIAIVIAFGRQAVDRRLRDAREVGQLLELPVIGDLREDALGCAPADDSSSRGQLSDLDLESVRMIRRNLDFLAAHETVKTVAITSALPKEGKSTLAAALAFSAAAIGRRTLLIECDLRRPVIADRLALQPKPGLTDYIGGEAEPDDILQIVAVEPSINGGPRATPGQLVCIVAGSATTRTDELLSAPRFHELLDEVSSVYDLVVLDSAPILPVADTLEILPLVDGVLLCVRVRQTTREQALAARVAIQRFPPRPVGVVVTAAAASDEYGSYAYNYGYSASAT